jgi:OmpA-OmpF porin, OOP family
MMNAQKSQIILPIIVVAATLFGASLPAQTKVEGVIAGRSGAQIILRTTENPKLIVLLTDETDVGQVEGMLKVRKKEMSMAALIPGLPVKVEGEYDAQGGLVAKTVRFKGNDLEQAQAIQAGIAETQQQAHANKEATEKNKSAIDATNARIENLDDYTVLDEVTVYFGSGKSDVEPKYDPQLLALADKAKQVSGYMIQVQGFASTSGSVQLNQKLSDERAANVTTILLAKGKVPLTNMLAPAALGEMDQVDGGSGKDSEAANRRVVVKVLQNKGVGGT